MITQKRVIILLLIALGIVAAFIVSISLKNTEPGTSPKNTVSPLTIEGLDDSQYSLNTETRRSITKTIEGYLKDDKIDTANITGTVREGSFIKSSVNDGVRTTVLIDLPTLKRTYKASVSNDADGYVGLYVVCPKNEELKYEPFECKDETTN